MLPDTLLRVACRVGVALGRCDAGKDIRLDVVAADAMALAKRAVNVRRALEGQRNPARELAALKRIAAKYSSIVVYRADPGSMVIGIQFPEYVKLHGTGHVMFVV